MHNANYNTILKPYFKRMADFKFLTPEAEEDLFNELKSLNNVDIKNNSELSEKEINKIISRKLYINNILFESCASFVIKIAKRYAKRGLEFSDIVQEGNLALLEAIKTFDVSLKCRLITYSSLLINQRVQKFF